MQELEQKGVHNTPSNALQDDASPTVSPEILPEASCDVAFGVVPEVLSEALPDTSPKKHAYPIPTLTVLLQPEEKEIILPRHQAKTVKRLLETLGIRECTALVVRDGQLLTPDRRLNNNDSLLVRKVTSSG